jgi:hypothetical protein
MEESAIGDFAELHHAASLDVINKRAVAFQR